MGNSNSSSGISSSSSSSSGGGGGGNSSSSSTKDDEYLNIQGNSFYESDLYKLFPSCMSDEKNDKTDNDLQDDHYTNHLIDLFVRDKSISDKRTSMISAVQSSESHDFKKICKARETLLMRIFNAYERYQDLRTIKIKELQTNKNSVIRKFTEKSFKQSDSSMTMACMSVSMCLAIAKSTSNINPDIFPNLSQSIISMLKFSGIGSLSQFYESSLMIKETLDNIFEYSREIASKTSGEIRSIAIGVMLQIAVASGSLPLCVIVARDLYRGEEILPEIEKYNINCSQTLVDLESIEFDYSIEYSKANELENIVGRLSSPKEAQKTLIFNCPLCSTVAADSTALYVWDSFSMTLYRMGNGYNSTLAGEILQVNSQVESQICNYLGINIDDYRSHWFSQVKGKTVLNVDSPDRNRSANWPFPNSPQDAGENDENYNSDESENASDEDSNNSDDDDHSEDDDNETEEESHDDSYESEPSNNSYESPNDDNQVESDSNSADGSNRSNTRSPKSESPKHDIMFPASLAICNGKLYLRMQYLLGELRLAVFNCVTLELESVVEIIDNSSDSVVEPYVYECMDSEPIDIRLVPNSGYLLDIQQATYDEQDVTEVMKGLISADGSYLHIDSISHVLGDPVPGIIKRVKIICNVRKKIPGTYNFDEAIGTHILSNLTSDGRKLLFIKRIAKEELTKNSLIFSGVKDIQIHSAYYQNINNENGNVTNTIKKLWLEYLENGHDNYTASNELFTDMQVNVVKYLWINYSIRRGELRSAAFVENTTFSFYDTIIVKMSETNNDNVTLEALTVDPLNGMSVEKAKELTMPPELSTLPKSFSKVQMIFVGNKLIIQQLKYTKLSSHMIHGTVFGFSLRNGTCGRKSDRRFLKKGGFPLGLAYEPTNKIIYSWDAIQVTFRQWKNNERVPHIYEPQSSDPLELIKSLSPEYRLMGLKSMNHDKSINKLQAAKIMCSLDKLSEPYRPSTHEIALAESSTYNEIVLLGEGSKNNEGRVLIKVRGINCFKRAEKNLTGYFIVTLDSGFNVISCRSFPTTVPGTDRMGDYLGSLHQDCLVCLVAIFGLDIDELGSRDSANQLKSLGATKVSDLKKGSVYCLIGSKGCNSGCAIEAHESGKVCTINERLPPLRIPLRVDCSFQSINILISTCHDILENFDANNIYNKVMLLSLLQILCGNVYHLLRGDVERDFMKDWTEEKKQSLKKVLDSVVNQPDVMGEEIFQCGLNLFLITLKLVYPTPQEKYGLLMMYLSGHNSATLANKDSIILEPLLNQLATSDEILKLLETDDSKLARSTFDSLITLLEKELSLAISGGESKNGSLLEAAVRCMYSHIKLCLCKSAKSLEVPSLQLIFEISTKLIYFCDKIISSLVSAGDGFVPKEIDTILRKSPIGSILPMVLSMISLVFSLKPELLQKDPHFITSLIEGLICFRTSLNRISSIIPTDVTNGNSQSTVVITQEKVYESEHPYASNMDEKTLISFPGATRVTITFDPETKTENGCDWLLFKDVETGAVYGSKYTGRNNRENWPGFGGRPELEIFASQFYMIFHSDGGIEDWGYKFTATAYISQTLTLPKHWLVSLDNQLAQTISSFVKSSLSYNHLLLDDQISVWLEDRLLIKPELFNSSIGTYEVDKLLFDLVDRPADSLAESLVSVMKKRVPEDQGNYNVISRAVYATCACLLKYNYLSEEALLVAKGESEVSDKLFKAWQCGQKMRHFFKQNVADEALERSTNEIISRALFLLRSPAEDKEDVFSDAQVCNDSLSLLSPDLLQQTLNEKPLTQPSPRSPRFQKKLNDNQKSTSLSDRIIKFLQSNVKIDDMEKLNKVRNVRAVFRSKGVDIIQKSLSYLESSISPFSISLLIQALTDQIRSFKRPDTSTPKIHYESGIEGASLKVSQSLSSNFGKYLNRLTELLKISYDYMMDDSIKTDKRVAWKNVTLQCLTALKLDYSTSDHNELGECNILGALEQTLLCHRFEDVVSGAEELLKVIVAGCFKNNMDCETPQITEFEVNVASFLERKFIEVKDIIDYMSALSSLYPPIKDESTRIIHGVVNVHSESVGYFFPLSEQKESSDFSISLLVQRNKSSVLDPIEFPPSIKVGSTVMKTSQVSNNDNTKEINLVGKITSIRESEIFVDWSNGKKSKYKHDNCDSAKNQEVTLVDTSVSGNIFVKMLSSRSNAIKIDSDDNSDSTSSYFGLRILPNGLISAFFGSDKERIELNSTSKLSPDQFSHVVLAIGEKVSLYVNGNIEASENIEKVLALLSENALSMDQSSFFIGQPPSYVSDRCLFNTGISGLIGNMDLYHSCVDETEVSRIFMKYETFLEEKLNNSHFYRDIWNLGILSVIKVWCTKGDIIFKNHLMDAKKVATTAVVIYGVGGPLQKLFALKILKMVLPTLSEGDIKAIKTILYDKSSSSITQYFVNEIGRLIGYSDIRLHLQESDDIKKTIAMEIAELIKCLSETKDNWKFFADEFGQCLHLAYTAVENVGRLASKEMEEEKSLEHSSSVQNIDLIYGTLYLLGSNSPSLMPGVECMYTTDAAFNEAGVILTLSKPAEEFTDISTPRLYGEQYRVYSTTTNKVCLVPTSKVSRTGTNSTCLSSEFLQENIDISALVRLFTAISDLEITEKREIRLPLKEFHYVTKTYESSHPYTNAIDSYTLVEFPGAESIEIKFSGQTSVENRTDYVLFYKNGLYIDHFGDKYTGRRGENNFPGIMGRKPLVINSGSFILHFHTESSTNNWGYSFTASATCLKQTITPPPLPYLYYCAINQYTKVCGLQALHSTIRCCPWLLLSLTSMSKSLLSSALSPLPKLRIPRTLNPLIIESNHPYEHNLDTYFPVKIKGAKKLSVTFDKNTSTESGCDFVRLYTDYSHTTVVPSADQFSGGKNGSSSNWPGLDDRPPLIIEGDSFEIFFHTDGSLNSWGWKMIVTPIQTYDVDCDIDEEYLNIDADVAYKSCCYMKELIPAFDSGNSKSCSSIQETSEFQFETEQPIRKHPSYADISQYIANSVQQYVESSPIDDVIINNISASSSWPRGLRVQKNIQLSIRKDPSPTADIMRIIPTTDNDEILAQREVGDWSFISHINGEAIEGWVKRRDRDIEYLIRDSCVEGCKQDIVRIPIAINNSDDEQKNDDSVIHLVANDIDTTISISRILKLKSSSWNKAFSAFACNASIGYSKSCLSQIFSKLPDAISLICSQSISDQYPILPDLLSLLHLELEDEEKSSSYKSAIVSNLKEVFGSQTKSLKGFLLSMLRFSLNYLKSYPISELEVPDMKALVKIVESPHPYGDNMDQIWQVRIPGAKKLRITFDEKSATETDNDFIYIVDSDDHSKRLYKHKIHGRNNGDKHWPGVGNCPPLLLQGDSCAIHMVTDAGVVDWGFKATLHGILEDPSEEEIVEYVSNRENRKKHLKYINVACWVLDLLLNSEDSDIQNTLYQASTVRLLQRFFTSVECEEVKALKAVRFLSSFIQNLTNVNLENPGSLYSEIESLKFNLTDIVAVNYEFNSLRSSPLEQALYELIVVISSCNYKVIKNEKKLDNYFRVSFGSPQLLSVDAGVNQYCEGYWIWSVKVLSFANTAPFIGFTGSNTVFGWGQGKLFFGSNDSTGVPFGPTIKPNDVISMHFNFRKGEVAYYRNGAFVGLAIGSKYTNAIYEVKLGNGPFQPICCLYDENDMVDIRSNINAVINGMNTTLEKQIPFWLKPLDNFSKFIQLLTEGKLPPLLISKYMLPSFIDYLKVTIDADTLPKGDSIEYKISIPGAERIAIVFDESRCHDYDTIRIVSNDDIYFEERGFVHEAVSSDLEFNINNISEFDILHHDDDAINESITVGDVVVRSREFCYGDQDGGPGNRGVVCSIQDWKGSARNGVNVKWDGQDDSIFLYRWGYRGVYDVTKVSNHDLISVNKIKLVSEPNSIIKVIDSDDLSVKLETCSDDFDRKFRLIALPDFSVLSALSNSSFQQELQKLQQHFMVSNTNLYLILAQYIDMVARKTSMTSDQALEFPWQQFFSNLDEAAQNSINEIYFQSNSAKKSNNVDVISTNNDNKSLKRSTSSNELSDSYHGPFKGFSLQGVIKDSLPYKTDDMVMIDPGDIKLVDIKFSSLEDAVAAGKHLYPTCKGITMEEDGMYTLRRGTQLIKSSSSETSYILRDPISATLVTQDDAQKIEARMPSLDLESKFGYLKSIESCFKFLQILNKSFKLSFPLINLSTADDGYLLRHITTNRGFLFGIIKDELFESALTENKESSDKSTFELRLSRSRVRKFARKGIPDYEGKWTIFSQAFRVIHIMPSYQLRKSVRLYTTIFVGEYAQDAGGPYRESFDIYAQELQSDMLTLLIRVNNGKENIGLNREKWIPNPDSTSSLNMGMFSFLGKLMGIAIRSKEYLSLNFPSLVWKKLINESLTMDDLEAIDITKAKCIKMMREIDEKNFLYAFEDIPFVTQSASGRTVELVPNGANKLVTYENRNEYCDLLFQYHGQEFDAQINAIKSGLGEIIPLHLLSLFSHDEVETMVCGKPIIDLTILKECTEYSGCSENDDHIKLFWQAMEEFTQEERSAFIRFTWGRSRLPLNKSDFQQKLKIQSFHKSPPDYYLPVSHTCFFSIELPKYSTLDIMKSKLRYAIANCVSIDGDNLIDNDQGRLAYEDDEAN